MSRVLGVDWGEARVGLALSDPAGRIASPLMVLDARKKNPCREIARMIPELGVETVVVGYPLSWDDRENPRCLQVRSFVESLRQATGLPVLAVDEWGTSRGGGDDSVSAARILQYYLDTRDHIEI